MATSTKMAGLLSIALMMGMANAQIAPVNGSVAPMNVSLPMSESGSESVLKLVGGPPLGGDGKSYFVAPLTENMGKGSTPPTLAV